MKNSTEYDAMVERIKNVWSAKKPKGLVTLVVIRNSKSHKALESMAKKSRGT